MLEKAIEIEGLLRIIRDGKPLIETYKLLDIKTVQLSNEVTALIGEMTRLQPDPASADFVMTAPAPTEPKPKVLFASSAPEPAEQPLTLTPEAAAEISVASPDMTEEDLALFEEDDIILSFEDVAESDQAMENQGDTPQEEQAAEPEDTAADIPTSTEGDGSTETEDTIAMEASEIPEAAEEPVKEASEPEKPEPTTAARRQVKLKSAFSLNDRFLYARELFNGNMKIFDSTLEFIEGIEDYSMVEDYFYSELEWNPEKPHVAAFMDIIRPHFKE